MALPNESPVRESKEETPQNGIEQGEAKAIIDGINAAYRDINKYDLPAKDGEIRKGDGEYVYRINVISSGGDRGILRAWKDKKGGVLSKDELVGMVEVQYQKKQNGDFKLSLVFQEANKFPEGRPAELHREQEVATAQLERGVFSEHNGALLKGKADKFLKIVNDYIAANKPALAGPMAVRDF